MKSVMIHAQYNELPPIPLGVRGENEVSEIVFDYSSWAADLGEGTVTLYVKRPVDSTAYPVVVEQDYSAHTAKWTVSATDTAYKGQGEIEWVYTLDEQIAKSYVMRTVVVRDIGNPASTPPDPYEDWLDTLTALGAVTEANAHAAEVAQEKAEEAQALAEQAARDVGTSASDAAESERNAAQSASDAADSASSASGSAADALASEQAAAQSETNASTAADRAEAAASHNPIIGNNGNWFIWDADEGNYVDSGEPSQGQQGPGATIAVGTTTTGEPGTNANVTNSGTSSAAVLNFTIPKGAKGDPGATGNGIASIAKTGTSGLVDTYTITFTNGDTTTFTVTNGASGGGLSEDAKAALLACFAKVAWIDAHGQDYYDALEDALYPDMQLDYIDAVYTQTGAVYPTDSLTSLKDDLVVTAHYTNGSTRIVTDYTLSGTLDVGTSTITVSYGGETDTFSVLVMGVVSISAVYTQSGAVHPTDSLDSLKSDLIVTATWSDTTQTTVPSADYTLSGTLAVGTSTITASYEGQTDTFTVTVTAPAVVTSISAVYTQVGRVYTTDSLDSLKANLVVTATWSDSSVTTVPGTDYTLSGTLEFGVSTITVTYESLTTTFTVNVSPALPTGYTLYDYVQTDGTQYISSGLNEVDLDGCGFQYKACVTGYPSSGTNYKAGHVFSSKGYYVGFLRSQYNSSDPTSPLHDIIAKRKFVEKAETYDWVLNHDYVIDSFRSDAPRSVSVDDVLIMTLANGSVAPSASYYYTFFTYGDTPNDTKFRFIGRLYYFKIFDSSDNLIHLYVPATNSSNVAGLYDTVGEAFYSSATSSPLAVGNL